MLGRSAPLFPALLPALFLASPVAHATHQEAIYIAPMEVATSNTSLFCLPS